MPTPADQNFQLPGSFKDFCLKLIHRVNRQELAMTEACYQVAGTMFIEEIEQNLNLLDIAHQAGVLELPDHHLPQPRAELWQQLVSCVNKLN